MIYTGYYAQLNNYIKAGLTPIAISGGVPTFYDTEKYAWWKFFAPSWDIFSKWKSGEITDDDYIKRFIPERLEILDKDKLKELFNNVTNPILLCYEKEGFCHRHIVADWLCANGYEVREWT